MKSLIKNLKANIRNRFPPMSKYSGTDGQVCFFGYVNRAPSIGEFFCGKDLRLVSRKRIRRADVLTQSIECAAGGAVSISSLNEKLSDFSDHHGRAVNVPSLVVIRKAIPDTVEDLMAGLKNSTTREDIRRIRKFGFNFRVTKDFDDVRTFYTDHHVPMVRQQFPDDGRIGSLDNWLNQIGNDGELVCADLGGKWVAGIFNTVLEDTYVMGSLGIRDADEAVRQKSVVSALLIASMERAVELRKSTATLGRSLPFLGKGPIWFKAKWGCTLEVLDEERKVQLFLDLRHATVRNALARSPVIHCEADEILVSTWLPPGEAALRAVVREVKRFPGISRWHVVTAPETLAAARGALDADDRILAIELNPRASEPLWLGQLISTYTQSRFP